MRTRSAGAGLGALEERVMEVAWRVERASVREVARQLVGRTGRRLAYTTVMTTLDRLYKKGLLERDKEGNAFIYRAAMSRDEYHRRAVEVAVGDLLARSAGPVLAGFVDAAEAADPALLRRLAELIASRRRGRR